MSKPQTHTQRQYDVTNACLVASVDRVDALQKAFYKLAREVGNAASLQALKAEAEAIMQAYRAEAEQISRVHNQTQARIEATQYEGEEE